MRFLKTLPLILLAIANLKCSDDSRTPQPQQVTYKYLALGDSYTIGQSVCETCRFPAQLKDSIQSGISNSSVNLEIVATTGWTTNNLIQSIPPRNLPNDYDLVTLLIGVNNQYQHLPFSIFETEFPLLVNTAIAKAKGDKSNVIVVSIPDYAYTPFGGGSATVSSEIQQYNAFANNYCNENGISFINITDITQQGINDPTLVASDGLHPSTRAYSFFVQRLIPIAINILSE